MLLFSVAGLGTLYFLQNISAKDTSAVMQIQNASLKNDVAKLQQEKADLDTNLQTTENKLQEATSVSSTDPLFYSLDGVPATVKKEIVPFDYTAEGLKSLESDCGSTHPENYFENLLSTFQGTNKIVYQFDFTGDGQGNHYKLTVLPNKMNYKTMGEFKNDFDMCSAGGEYPTRMNSKWLIIEGDCVDDNYNFITKSKVDCTELKNKLIQTLEFN